MSAVENQIRNLRHLTDRTLAELAADLSVNVSTLARWETGSRTVPDEMKVRISRFFGLPVHSVFSFDSGHQACALALEALVRDINDRERVAS